MEPNEEKIFIQKAYIIHPDDHNYVYVDIVLTDYAVYIAHFANVGDISNFDLI